MANRIGPAKHDGLISALRGLRNGIITGVRIRVPYVLQSAIYAILFTPPPKTSRVSRVRFVIKQMFHHGRNLGLFVGIYKSISYVLRKIGMKGGLESWIAGAVGGYFAFGESQGISGGVNNQIVMYLFARGVLGALKSRRGFLPSWNVDSPRGFRIFAAFTLALILYLTEYEPETLQPSFVSTMRYLYYASDEGEMMPPPRFAPFVVVILVSLILGSFYPEWSLDSMLTSLLFG